MPTPLAIVTQDPSHAGGVLRLVEYIYRRAEAAGREPEILHYASFRAHPELHASLANLLRGELNITAQEKRYSFHGMRARAFGALLPEWEPQRIRANALWRRALQEYSSAILVTGSAQTGLVLSPSHLPYRAWISATVADDRRQRLQKGGNFLEKCSMPSILRAEKKVLEHAQSIMAVSQMTKAQLTKVTTAPSEVWPFPVDTQKFSPAPSTTKGTIRFLFVGRAADPRKRIELFFEACAAVRTKRPDLDFRATVISSNDRTAPTSVEWVSNISERDLIEYYQHSTALVLTSEQEGLGIAAMEAMACGTPVISTRSGGPETFIEDGVSGFFANTKDEIADRMIELATRKELRQKMGEAARENIDQAFSERVWNEKFEKILRFA